MNIPKEELELIRQLLWEAFNALNHHEIEVEIMTDELHDSKVVESRKFDFQGVDSRGIDSLGLTTLCAEMSSYLDDELGAGGE